ncbi:helix-turn-helix domain-containing protein [Sporosarcina sp. G11-34]|uniref:helix-turn-helix domain-containing protein n=1 Tax=Sporosarcina sp. G11-34 TaxID=2849605 RepID=UPI0022A995A4|nr:cupin domain-containing protein [Sporosarcina sp. G11-34]MCZ2257341.1 cupin domain-containing protein [Sporosarcina sp. G11-34]
MNEKIGSIGEQIRSIRKSKGITINDVSKKTGFTSSFISQLERNLTKGSVASIQKIASALEINVSSLFHGIDEENHKLQSVSIIRKENRRKMTYPDGKTIDYLLTGQEGNLEVIYSTVEPGGGSGTHYSHDSEQECIIILDGQMEISVDKSTFILNTGDTINFSSRLPHAWRNIGEDSLKVIWIITPPTF